MNMLGFGVIAATGVAAGLVGLAAPASAEVVAAPVGMSTFGIKTDVAHHQWVVDTQQQVKTPRPAAVGDGR